MSEELKCSFYANGGRAVDQKMALELFKAKALIGGLRKELDELREAAREVVEAFDGSVITLVSINKLAALLRESSDE